MQIPSSNLKNGQPCQGIEYGGCLFIVDESKQMSYSEFWFIAREYNKLKKKEIGKECSVKISNIEHIAKILHAKEKWGCVYDDKIETLLTQHKNEMFVLK